MGANELALTESRSLREQYADRTDVLDKVKTLALLPDGVHTSVEQSAAYYEVHPDAIEKVIRNNREELDGDGMAVLTGARLSAFKAESGYRSRAASLTLLPRRALLRIGMLLRDSRVAQEVRTYLLDAETGSLGDPLAELELSNQRLGKAIEIAKAERAGRLAAEERATELEGPAHAWDVLASGKGDYSVADAAKILSRDPAISIGERRLFAELFDAGWIYRQTGDRRWRVYQVQIDNGRLSELPQEYEDKKSGELTLGAPQVRVKVKGLRELHRQLGGVAAPRFGEQLAIGGA